MIRFALAVVLAVWPTLAKSEPEVGDMFGPAAMSGGMICDTLAEVHGYIDAVQAQDPALHPPGCGRLMQPMMMTWQIIEIFEAHGHRFIVARFLIHTNTVTVTQFGILGTPEKLDEAA